MRQRYIVQMTLLIGSVILLTYLIGDTRIFGRLRQSESERILAEGEQVILSGQIEKKEIKNGKAILYLKDGHTESHTFKGERIPVYVQQKEMPETGMTVVVSGKVRFYQGPRNPGNFNQKFYYQKQGIYMSLEKGNILKISGTPCAWREALFAVREEIKETINTFCPGNEGGLLCAMIMGDKSAPEAEIKEVMSKSGIGHLLAVSGLHVSFFGMGVYRLLRKAGARQSVCAVTGILLLSVYIAMIGVTVSALRAWVMFLIQMGAKVTGRVYDGLTALGVSALVIFVWNPVMILDAGFWLSVSALAGIYGLAPCMVECMGKKGRWQETLAVSIAVQLTMLPVLLLTSYEYAVYSLLWNIFALFLSSFVMGGGVLGILVGEAARYFKISFLGEMGFAVPRLILSLYEKGSSLMLSAPMAKIVTGRPHPVRVVFYLACLLVFWTGCASSPKKYRRLRKGARLIVLAAGILVLMTPSTHTGELELVMLDVGQGDGIFFRGPKGVTYLVDGGSSTVSEVGKYRIEPFLKYQGVGTLDYVFVSHGDADHFSGVKEMLAREKVGIRIRNLVLPEKKFWDENLTELARLAWRNGVAVCVMEKGQVLAEGEMEITCLWPEPGCQTEAGNETSLVLSVVYKDFSALLTGDLEKEAEKSVAEQMEKESYTVLKAGHHGSKYATSEEFLEKVNPLVVWISAGEDNQYGHPHEETLERIEKAGSRIDETAKCGAVIFQTDGKGLKRFDWTQKIPSLQKKGNIVY